MEQIAFNQSLPHMKEKSFTKTDELPSSLWNIQRATLVVQRPKVRWIWYCLQIRAKRWITRADSRTGFTKMMHIFCTQNN
jgi:hypothetical protein